jgi:hypothetical protein
MDESDDLYTLEGLIEAEEDYFTIEASKLNHETKKAGRGSKTRSNVMVMAESTVLEDIVTGKVERQARYFKAKVLTDHRTEGTDGVLREAIENNRSLIFTDESTSYVNIADYVDIHISEKSRMKITTQTLKWVHIAISNAKRNFTRIYHKIKANYL